MSFEYQIGSFNIQDREAARYDMFWRNSRISRISNLIVSNKLDLLFLQDVSQSTVDKLARVSGYRGMHCRDWQEDIRVSGAIGSSPWNSETAFLWNPKRFQFVSEWRYYNGIYNRIRDEWISSCLAEMALGIRVIGVLSPSPVDRMLVVLENSPLSQQNLQTFFQQYFPMPSFAIFRPVSGSNSEFRFVNVWLPNFENEQVSPFLSIAAKYLLGRIHTIVNTHRNGDSRCVYTLFGGDWGMEIKQLGKVLLFPAIKADMEKHRMLIIQNEQSTLKIRTSASDSEPLSDPWKSYDHFAYDLNRLTGSAAVIPCRKKELFIDRKPISRHIPIKMCLKPQDNWSPMSDLRKTIKS